MIFCHIRYYNWSKEALQESARAYWAFRTAVDCPLYVIGDTDDRKFERFVRRFGFSPFTQINCTDGKARTVFISIKDNSGHVLY